jgi:hypothetical protein
MIQKGGANRIRVELFAAVVAMCPAGRNGRMLGPEFQSMGHSHFEYSNSILPRGMQFAQNLLTAHSTCNAAFE